MHFAFLKIVQKDFADNGYWIIVHIRSLGYLAWVHLVP